MRRLEIIPIALACFMAVSCGEDFIPDYQAERDCYLTNETSVDVYSPEEFVETISTQARSEFVKAVVANLTEETETIDNILDLIFSGLISTSFPIMDIAYSGRPLVLPTRHDWNIERHVFTYRTVSYEGREIELSGVVTFPRSTKEKSSTVSSLSLVNHTFMMVPDDVPSKGMDLLCKRVLFNSAVIEPDFEGYGFTEDRVHSGSAFDILAKQSVDCAMAALELMENYGVTLADGGYTTNWGISLGAPTAVAVQRQIENHSSAAVQSKLKLRSTYSAEGPLDVPGYLEYLNDNPQYSRTLTMPCVNSILVVPSNELGGFNRNSYWNPSIMSEFVDEEKTTRMFDEVFLESRYISLLGNKDKVVDFNYLFNPDMVKPDGNIDFGSPRAKAMMEILYVIFFDTPESLYAAEKLPNPFKYYDDDDFVDDDYFYKE